MSGSGTLSLGPDSPLITDTTLDDSDHESIFAGQNKPKRKRSLYYNSDSSEGEDMVQIALRLQREKQKRKEQQVQNEVAAKNNIGP